ncbi:hypothetical protein G7007_19345 [Pseudomonas entomophila]|uniref:hypothetical protein n=1 Tax=Pseudomonas entomophila TaxID=312306 RepID=UPI0015E3626F|nr:hypothetical protein [Pseudomonas entomophila]MBA1194985.1 hypothetical protein [Pseudomonas entomophila]
MSEHHKPLRVATIIPAPASCSSNAHMTMGTKVLLSDGSELRGVQSIELKASAESGAWQAVITVLPLEVPQIVADAEIVEGEAIEFTTVDGRHTKVRA